MGELSGAGVLHFVQDDTVSKDNNSVITLGCREGIELRRGSLAG